MREADEILGQAAKVLAEPALLEQFAEAVPTAGETVAVRQIERQLRTSPAWRPDRRERHGWFSAAWLTPAAAGLVALLVVGAWFHGGPDPSIDSNLTRSLGVEGIEPVGDLDRPPLSVRWSPVPGAVRYEVALLDIEEQVIWSGSQSSTELRLPAEALSRITTRQTMFWRIGAFDSRGTELAIGAPRRFRVTSN